MFNVSPWLSISFHRKKEKFLLARMQALGVREQNIVEQFVRASGAGGQKVNKASTCVVLHRRPTGIRVKRQRERSQALNRFFARRILPDNIEARLRGARSAQEQEIARIRRQKRKRSRRARLKLLANKRHQAEKHHSAPPCALTTIESVRDSSNAE
jgi:protein subunit release factor B